MDSSRTHEQTRSQPWALVAIGVVVVLIAALTIGIGTDTDDVAVMHPAGPAAEFDAGAATQIRSGAGEGSHSPGEFASMRTANRVGGEDAEAAPAGIPSVQDRIHDGPVYPGRWPGRDFCAVKQQCG